MDALSVVDAVISRLAVGLDVPIPTLPAERFVLPEDVDQSLEELVDNEVDAEKAETLPDRINSCVRLGLNGRPLPEDSREMTALIAYIEFVGKDTPEGVRLPDSGLKPIALPGDIPRQNTEY